MKVNNITGILETFAAVPSLEKVHILEDGRHYFNEDHAKAANGSETVTKDKKQVEQLKKVSYKTYAKDAKELKDAAAEAAKTAAA